MRIPMDNEEEEFEDEDFYDESGEDLESLMYEGRNDYNDFWLNPN